MADTLHTIQSGENLTGIANQYGTTVSALQNANGISNPNLIIAGKTLKIPGSQPPPAAVIPPAGTNPPPAVLPPTPAVKTTLPPGSYVSPDDAALQKALAEQSGRDQTTSNNPVMTEDEYRAQALAAMQGEIDAQNKIYADKIADAKVEGQGRLGSEGAIQARRGLLGSDFGAASTDTVKKGNDAVVNSIQDELNAKLESIRSLGRSEGTAKYEAATKAKKEGLDSYITDLQNRATTNKSIIQKVAAKYLEQGIDPNTDSNYLEQVAKEAGVTSSAILSEFKAQSDAKKLADDKATQDLLKSNTDLAKTNAEIEKMKTDTAQVTKKFEEDKREFGLEYALKQYQASTDRIKANSSAGGSTGSYTPGADKVVDSWAERIQNGTAKITEIPASQAGLRNKVTVALQAMGNSSEGKPTTTELGKAALANAKSLMDKLNSHTGTAAVGGSRALGGGLLANIPGSQSFGFKNDFDAVKSQLSLEGVKYLKGQGQVSDAERALLAQAVTKLNLSQSEGEFKSTLQGVIDKLEGNVSNEAPASSGFSVADPTGTVHSFNSQADLDAFKKAAGL